MWLKASVWERGGREQNVPRQLETCRTNQHNFDEWIRKSWKCLTDDTVYWRIRSTTISLSWAHESTNLIIVQIHSNERGPWLWCPAATGCIPFLPPPLVFNEIVRERADAMGDRFYVLNRHLQEKMWIVWGELSCPDGPLFQKVFTREKRTWTCEEIGGDKWKGAERRV